MNPNAANNNVLGGALARGLGLIGEGQAIGQRYVAEQQAQKVSELQEQAERLEKAITRMREVVTHLGSRLVPVLRPRGPEEAKNSSDRIAGGPASAHGQYLGACATSVDALTAEMSELLQRLAV